MTDIENLVFHVRLRASRRLRTSAMPIQRGISRRMRTPGALQTDLALPPWWFFDEGGRIILNEHGWPSESIGMRPNGHAG